MQLQLNQSCFPGLSLARFLDLAAQAGADGVDLAVKGHADTPAAIAAAVHASGMHVSAIHALIDWALPDDPDPRSALTALLDVALATNASLIVCVAPLRMDRLPPAAEIQASTSERLAMLAELVRPTRVRLALEQVGRSSSRPGALSGIRRLRDAFDIAAAAADDVLLVVDSYNLATADEPFEVVRQVPVTHLGIAHLADGHAAQEGRLPAGEGDLDLATFVRVLWQTGYSGALSLEIFPTTPWTDPLVFAQQMLAIMRRYVQSAQT